MTDYRIVKILDVDDRDYEMIFDREPTKSEMSWAWQECSLILDGDHLELYDDGIYADVEEAGYWLEDSGCGQSHIQEYWNEIRDQLYDEVSEEGIPA